MSKYAFTPKNFSICDVCGSVILSIRADEHFKYHDDVNDLLNELKVVEIHAVAKKKVCRCIPRRGEVGACSCA
jgi:hypothetical protein